MLHSGQVHPLYRGWAEFARERLRTLDTTLLQAIAPPRRTQLKLVASWPPELLRAELEGVWQGLPMPDAARQLIADGPAGARRVAAALAVYGEAVMAPDWEHMRAVIDAEIAYRARQLVLGGISAMLNDLHPRLQLDHATIRLNKTGQQNYGRLGRPSGCTPLRGTSGAYALLNFAHPRAVSGFTGLAPFAGRGSALVPHRLARDPRGAAAPARGARPARSAPR